ncbi:MAG: TonB-dependent receptor [Bacteroidota bacterium]|nr:TonB-dependent receptor [Bacteroidota bacterium]
MKKLFLYLIIFLSPAMLFAQSKPAGLFEIRGQAVDSLSKEEIPYATISIALGEGKNVIKRMACDLNGKFTTPIHKPGHYILTFQSMGFKQTIKNLDITDTKKVISLGKVFLSKGSEALNEVVVSAIKPLVKVEVDKITYSAETDPESKTSNVLDILRKVPLITVDGDDNIQLKGASNFKIHLNGKPSTLLSNDPKQVLKSMPASSIKNIEVITNPSSKYDAEGVGGIINIITTKKTIQGYTGSVNAGTSTTNSYNGGLYASAKLGKFGFSVNYGASYRNNPYTTSTSERENFNDDSRKYLNYDGKTKYKGPFQYGYGEASYEVDTLNLISMSFNRFQGNQRIYTDQLVETRDVNFTTVESYNNIANSKMTFGSTEGNIDYQRSFKKEGRLLTFSYKIDYNPNNSNSYSAINNILNFYDQEINIDNKAHATEQTFQADYVEPITKVHGIEAGLKFILRDNTSNTDYQKNGLTVPEQENDFNYTQDIYAAYTSYNLKWKKIGFRTGVRMEHTKTKGEYIGKSNSDFNNEYTEFIPSANLSYQLSATDNVRFSYTQRIQRPGIWYLNPYVNDADPKNIHFGNPKLDPEKSNSFDLNLSKFATLGSINVDLSYSFTNNGIESITTVENGIGTTTYDNIGSNKYYGASLYGSLKLGSKINLFANGSLDYRDIKSKNGGLKNNGYGFHSSGGMQYSLPKNFKLSLNGGFFKSPVGLQSKSTNFYYTSIGINKELLNRKMTLSLAGSDLFWHEKKYSHVTFDSNFRQKSTNYYPARSIRFNISYRFGEMKAEIKKVQRGINNDDVKSGGGSSEGSGGQSK